MHIPLPAPTKHRSRQAVQYGVKLWLRLGALFIVLALIVWFVHSNRHELGEAIGLVGRLPVSALVISAALVGVTFILAASSYRMLAFRHLSFHELFTVEMAAAFVNRLVPSGLGGLGVHGLYLHARKHSAAQATVVVSTNNLLGLLTHVCLLAILTMLAGGAMTGQTSWHIGQVAPYALGLIIISILVLASPLRRAIYRFLRNMVESLHGYADHAPRIMLAALSLSAMTCTNVLILSVMASALGVEMGITKLFFVYSAGVLVGAAIPTPGGLAGVETGLAGGFIAYGIPDDMAIAVALAFRLVTYWFPLLPGAIAFVYARARGYILSRTT